MPLRPLPLVQDPDDGQRFHPGQLPIQRGAGHGGRQEGGLPRRRAGAGQEIHLAEGGAETT